MRFQYSTIHPTQNEFDSLPRIPLTLEYNGDSINVSALVDSGATINVLPQEVGAQLGATWEQSKANIRLAGNLGSHPAMPLVMMGHIQGFESVQLAFAWVQTPNAPLILGQTNFFMEFDIHFYRSRLEFEITRVV